MIQKRKVVVFDLDDTLYKEIDFLKSAYRHIASLVSNAQVSKEEVYQLMWETYQQKGNAFEAAVKTFGFHLYTVDWMINVYRYHQPNIFLDEETKTTLMRLKDDGVAMGILSDGRMITQTNKIRALGLYRFFDEEDIIINEVETRFKPDMKSFCIFMERYGKDAEYWYIGDNTSKDFMAPNSLGWITVCLLNDGRNIHQQDFKKEKIFMPKYMVYNISDVIEQKHLIPIKIE